MRALLATLLLCALCVPASAQVPVRLEAEVAVVESEPEIDGVLDDSAWDAEPTITRFVQINPVEGAEPTQLTEVWLARDHDALYIAIRSHDTEAGKIVARAMQRDSTLASDDHITIVLDTFDDRRNRYTFLLGAGGAKRDGLISNGGRVQWEWDGLWKGKASVDDKGWTAELAIPFKTVSFDATSTAWGFNVQRVIRRNNETVRWSGARRDAGILDIAEAGTLEGMTELNQGYGLTLQPFFTGKMDLDRGEQSFEPGLDIFYQITPSITASLTFNTDFAETEVDQRRVNLTRFPLFFPEKRDFFLQDAGLFSFGGINQSPLPFHSRRIGIVDGEEKGILAGAKVTGRAGKVGFGILDVQMEHDDELGNKNLGVARATLDVLEESTIGVIMTNGDPSQRGRNTLLGADFNFRTTTLVEGATLDGGVWIQGTHSDPTGEEAENDDVLAFGGRLSFSDDPWSGFVFMDQVGEDYNPALGFVSRPGERENIASTTYTYYPAGGTEWLRSINFTTRGTLFTDLDWDVKTASWVIPTVQFNSEAGDFVRTNFEVNREVLDETFEISDGVPIAPGTYDGYAISVNSGTSGSRIVRGGVFASYEEFFTGYRIDSGGNVGFRPNQYLDLSAEYSQNDIDLATGAFVVRVVRGNANFFFSPEVSWQNTVQWDDQSDLMGFNSRLRWEVSPGQDLYIVYNEGLDTTDSEFNSVNSDATIKVGLTFRF